VNKEGAMNIDWLVSMLVGLFIGIGGNLLSPIVQEWLESVPAFVTEQRLATLKKELEHISELYADRSRLFLDTASTAFLAFVFFSIANAAWAFPGFYIPNVIEQVDVDLVDLIANLIAIVFFVSTIVICLNHIRLIAKIRNYAPYKDALERRIKGLETKMEAHQAR
jgi:hypothetical protein